MTIEVEVRNNNVEKALRVLKKECLRTIKKTILLLKKNLKKKNNF